jgi:DNA polymerase III epsilon subunit-like protein
MGKAEDNSLVETSFRADENVDASKSFAIKETKIAGPEVQADDPGYVFIDTETTGLDAQENEIFELALIVKPRSTTGPFTCSEKRVHLMFGPERIETANDYALQLSDYHKRSQAVGLKPGMVYDVIAEKPLDISKETIVKDLADLVEKAHLVGANPAFDARFLEEMFKMNGQKATWSHRLIDVEVAAMTKDNMVAPIGLQKLAEKYGIDSGQAHTAMDDIETTVSVFEEIIK